MRICSPQLGLSPTSILGGEIYDREILTGLTKLGCTIDICLPYHKPYPQVARLNVSYLPLSFVVPPHIYNVASLPYMLGTYKKYSFDILRIHSPTFIGLGAAAFKKIHPQVPIVGVYHWLGEGGWIGNKLTPYLSHLFDAIICDSHFTRDLLGKLYPIILPKIYTIHNGVDQVLHSTPKPSSLLKKYSLGVSTTVLLFMGIFSERKNPLFLIELMKHLKAAKQDVILLLCGQGELETTLKQKIHEFDLGKFIFIIPPVFGSAKNELLNFADIFVHPAKNEGFSLAVIEAMAVGLPVVITNKFSASEAVTHGKHGYLADRYSDWLVFIKRLIKEKKLRQGIKKNNIAKVRKEFTWDLAIKRHLDLFQTILKT